MLDDAQGVRSEHHVAAAELKVTASSLPAAADALNPSAAPEDVNKTMTDPNQRGPSTELVTYAYILLYIALSSGQIFFNKWVLSSKEINFPYPLGLTLLHMVFSSVLCFVLIKVLKIMKVEEGMTLDIYITSVIPIGAMFAVTLWLGNTAYLYISVAFAQMLKAIMPVAVFCSWSSCWEEPGSEGL